MGVSLLLWRRLPLNWEAHTLSLRDRVLGSSLGIIGSSGVVSEVVNGKRAISKAQAKALGDYFKVSPSLFI